MIKSFRKLFLALLLGVILLGVVQDVSAATVNITDKYLGYGSKTVSNMKTLKKKIGGMKEKKSKSFPAYYATGNKMTLGLKKGWAKVLIKNGGNKKVSILGVKIGMTRAKAEKLLTAKYYRSYDEKNVYWQGDAAYIKLGFKNGKVKSWKYLCEATG